VSYAVLEVEGPPHDRRFSCAAMIDGEQLGIGTGESKKEAEQGAAKEALVKLGVEVSAA
jgi:ribonuclease-3